MGPLKTVQDAWRIAASKIGFEFVSPFELSDEYGQISYHGLVRGFGSELGTVFIASSSFEEDCSTASRVAKKNGFYFSEISIEIYSIYKRDVFLEALKDWGWYGRDLEPPPGFKVPVRTAKRRPSR